MRFLILGDPAIVPRPSMRACSMSQDMEADREVGNQMELFNSARTADIQYRALVSAEV